MMGDIVQTGDDEVELSVEVAAPAPIERIEIRNGTGVVELFRPYGPEDLGSRVRGLWAGAEDRGRGRQTSWIGRARFEGARVLRVAKINAWNHERRLEQTSSDTVEWDALTTGNFGGFDAVLAENGASNPGGRFELTCNHGSLSRPLAEIGRDDIILEAAGLERRIRVFRLPRSEEHTSELQSLMRISYAVFCLKKKNDPNHTTHI